MRVALIPAASIAAAALLFAAGCGGSEGESTTKSSARSSADLKKQVEQVCSEATRELDGLPDPLDTDTAARVQGQSAQIFKTAVAKLNELDTDVGFPVSYKSWLAEFEQLPALNEASSEAFSGDGVASGQAAKAADAWEKQAQKANGLARSAGLSDCVFGEPKAG
jgi:gas vesicle protein